MKDLQAKLSRLPDVLTFSCLYEHLVDKNVSCAAVKKKKMKNKTRDSICCCSVIAILSCIIFLPSFKRFLANHTSEFAAVHFDLVLVGGGLTPEECRWLRTKTSPFTQQETLHLCRPPFMFLHFHRHTSIATPLSQAFFFFFGPSKTEQWLTGANLKANIKEEKVTHRFV